MCQFYIADVLAADEEGDAVATAIVAAEAAALGRAALAIHATGRRKAAQ